MKKSLILVIFLISISTYALAATFHGYECLEDSCSGHEAGYAWAEEKGIDNPDNCGGNSQSFIEGCKAWAGEDGDAVDDNPND